MSIAGSEQHRRARIASTIGLGFYVAATFAVALFFNFWPEKIALISMVRNTWNSSPLLTTGFRTYLPALNALWGLSILLHLAKMRYRRESALIRGASLVLQVYGAILVGILAANAPALFTPSAVDWIAWLLAALGVAMGISALKQARQFFRLEAVTFMWEDAEMDRA